MLQVPGKGAAFIGRTSDGKIERALSDRLCGLGYPSSGLAKELKRDHKVDVRDCLVYAIEIKDPESRKLAKKDGIKHFRPIGNH
jgi:hypothetical protein